MDTQLSSSLHRIAFYPCCAGDIAEPRHLLTNLVDEIIYCDLRKSKSWSQVDSTSEYPIASFVQEDVRTLIEKLPTIQVLFYRRDSAGEGGSNLFILGKSMLSRIITHFPESDGLIVTDGSNSGSCIFKRMIRRDGYTRKSWHCHFQPRADQPWFQSHGLHIIEVTKLIQQGGEHVR
jgi:hypothetical protein